NVQDGNDYAEISQAIRGAQADPRPSLIICRTTIGYGLPTRQGTPQAHGEPPGEDELAGAKRSLGWPVEGKFFVPEEVLDFFRQAIKRGGKLEQDWEELFQAYQTNYPDLAAEFLRRFSAELPPDWDSGLKLYPADTKGMATRAASGKAINALAAKLPELIGGSADLAPSNKTWIDGSPAFQKDSPEGRNLHFGVRENAMGSIVNGMAVFGGLIPYGGTFLVFSDYMRPAIRLSALSHYPSIWVFTHDSVGVGEDGPTHQPVEHIAALRAIPNLVVLRPGDANEVNEAWKFAISHRDGPTALILSRQNMPTLDRDIYPAASELNRGAYVLADMGESEPEIILMASGTEVGLALNAAGLLAAEGVNTRVVTFPSWELFAEQDQHYQEAVFPKSIKARLAIEAGVSDGWYRWVGSDGDTVSVDHFGASAPADIVYDKFGLTVENIVKQARLLLG
ncbi:MAG: transketolase, partial [Anaerolineales bacterium]|nr:transketolase [Anaerolineales bacterium]